MSDFESRLSDLALQFSTLKGHWDNGLGLIQKLLLDVPKLESRIESMRSDLANHRYEVASALLNFDKLQHLVATIREEFSRNLSCEIKSIVKNVEDKHFAISSLADVLKEKITKFESLIDEIALDARNAVLKANNAEMVTVLNKKKIEQACLLVQNQQLSK